MTDSLKLIRVRCHSSDVSSNLVINFLHLLISHNIITILKFPVHYTSCYISFKSLICHWIASKRFSILLSMLIFGSIKGLEIFKNNPRANERFRGNVISRASFCNFFYSFRRIVYVVQCFKLLLGILDCNLFCFYLQLLLHFY